MMSTSYPFHSSWLCPPPHSLLEGLLTHQKHFGGIQWNTPGVGTGKVPSWKYLMVEDNGEHMLFFVFILFRSLFTNKYRLYMITVKQAGKNTKCYQNC